MKRKVKLTLIYVVATALILLWLVPIFYLVIIALKPTGEFYMYGMFSLPKEPTLRNFGIAWDKIKDYFFNSLFYVVIAVPLIIFISTMASYALSRFEIKGQKFWVAYLMLGMLLPIHVTLLPNYMTLSQFGLINSRLGMLLIYTVLNIPFTFFLTRGHFLGINKEIEESARVDGCPTWQIYFRIILPLSTPAIIISLVMNFMNVWNDLVLAMTYTTRDAFLPVTAGLLRFVEEYAQNYERMTAGILISIIPVSLVFFFLQKHIVAGMAEGAIKG